MNNFQRVFYNFSLSRKWQNVALTFGMWVTYVNATFDPVKCLLSFSLRRFMLRSNLCLLILQHDKTISIKLYQNKATTFSKNTVTRQHLISFLKGVLHSDRITLVSLIYQTILVKTNWNSPHFFHKPVHKQQKFSHSPHITMLCGLLASELNFVNGGRDEQDFLVEFQ